MVLPRFLILTGVSGWNCVARNVLREIVLYGVDVPLSTITYASLFESFSESEVAVRMKKAPLIDAEWVLESKGQPKKLGSGAYGTVVACKLPYAHVAAKLASSDSDSNKLAKEICTLIMLNMLAGSSTVPIPIPTILGVVESPLAMLMPRYQADLSKSRRVTMVTLPVILGDVARALEFMHCKGYIHGDVKPGNVLIDVAAGQIRGILTDFNQTQLVSTSPKPPVGTSLYRAPEARTGTYGTEVDIYAVGKMLMNIRGSKSNFDQGTARLSEALEKKCCSLKGENQKRPSATELIAEFQRWPTGSNQVLQDKPDAEIIKLWQNALYDQFRAKAVSREQVEYEKNVQAARDRKVDIEPLQTLTSLRPDLRKLDRAELVYVSTAPRFHHADCPYVTSWHNQSHSNPARMPFVHRQYTDIERLAKVKPCELCRGKFPYHFELHFQSDGKRLAVPQLRRPAPHPVASQTPNAPQGPAPRSKKGRKKRRISTQSQSNAADAGGPDLGLTPW